MSIDSSTPILTAVDASDPSYGAPNSANVICNSAYGMSTIWSGPGGTFEIRPTGNLLSLATLSPAGIVYLLTPGSEFVTLDLTGGTGVGITQSGRDFIISVLPNTTIQQVNVEVDGIGVSNTSTLNFLPGAGIGITGIASGDTIDLTFSSSGADNTASYITKSTESSLPDSFSLGSLSSGLLKVSVSSGTGTPATAIGNTDYMLVNSKMTDLYNGTPTAGSLFYYTGGHWNSIAPGTTGYVLTVLSSTSIGWQPGGGGGSAATWSQYPALEDVDMDGFGINNLLDPVSAQDAATKNYVDTHGGGGGAPVDATYLTSTSNSTLTNEVNLGALATGLLLGTVASGISTISSVAVSTFVDTSSTQTITGAKTFTGTTVVDGTTFTSTSISSDLIASGFTGSQLVTKQAGIQTANTTPTVLVSIPLSTNEAVTVTGTVTGSDAAHSDYTGGFFCVTAGRGAGNIALATPPFPIVSATSTGLFDISVDVGTQAILVTVTGINTSYNWVCNYNYQKVLSNS